MNFIGISLNHNSSPLEIREALHFNNDEILNALNLFKENLDEPVILSTCNRTEIFGFPKNYSLNNEPIINKLISIKNIEGIKKEYFRNYFSCGAVKHLFSVAAGIDSMIIGDSQILGQVKDAYELSNDLGLTGTITQRIFDSAFRVGKRAINETSIGEGAVTVSFAAVQVVEKIFSNLNKKSALIIGAGETGELAAIHLKEKGIKRIAISNRTLEKAEKLAEKIYGEIVLFQSLKDHLHEFDIIISATSSNDFIISYDDIKSAVKKRKGSLLVLMDIAVPRDIDPKVRDIENIFYHDMDSLKIIVDQNIQKRKEQIPLIEKMIFEEMYNFFTWYNTLEIVPTIKAIKTFFEDIRNDELKKIKSKVSEDDFLKIEDMTRRMIGRLLHNPIIKLREFAEQGTNNNETTSNIILLKELFNLDKYFNQNNFNRDEKE
ncbi:MAG: glutamyl-tRNA reductase [Melioribacteraceae bacterium]|nr:glutamyl-tRNA reductase [Melioribacteraceae bacterium]